MKLTMLLGTLFLFSLSVMAFPVNYPPAPTNSNTIADITSDQEFINSVRDVYALQLKVNATNSTVLLTKSMMGTLTTKEKTTLSSNMGFADYTQFTANLDRMSLTILSLTEKYAGLKEEDIAKAVSYISAEEMMTAYTGGGGGNNGCTPPPPPNPCLTQLYKDLFACVKSTGNCFALRNCLQAAYVKYNTCKNTDPGPR